jgi:hypothetical protein
MSSVTSATVVPASMAALPAWRLKSPVAIFTKDGSVRRLWSRMATVAPPSLPDVGAVAVAVDDVVARGHRAEVLQVQPIHLVPVDGVVVDAGAPPVLV